MKALKLISLFKNFESNVEFIYKSFFKKYQVVIIFSALSTILLLCVNVSMASKINSNGSGGGNWNTTTSWSGSIIPSNNNTDTVAILSSDVITIPHGTSIYYNGTLLIYGKLIIQANDNSTGGKLIMNASSSIQLHTNGDIEASGPGSTGGKHNQLTIGSATLRSNDINLIQAPNSLTESNLESYGDRSNPLPVVLKNFRAEIKGSSIVLSWSTISENGFEYFEIEKSSDAKNYNSIGIKEGTGFSQSKIDYLFHDAQPLPGVNYYRLKAVDFDGYIEYFAPIAVFNNNVQLKVATLVGDHQLRIFSNLSAEAKIYNLQGLPVHSGTITSGVNDINLPATVSSGYYIVGIYAGNELIKKEKVLVQ